MKKIRACQIVKDCIENKSCDELNAMFTITAHDINTRNNGFLLKLPKCRTEYGKRSFGFMAAKIYNDLPLETRKNLNNNNFISLVKSHFD